ncbi:TerD family protein [Skermania piniformis]|uniref:TerD family protein n=1 Tax=Skermania pinensis TaxID=39122 RepID=A0ABX8SAF0_9ACTN|nr:TerD family protein [Skermania piniformis]
MVVTRIPGAASLTYDVIRSEAFAIAECAEAIDTATPPPPTVISVPAAASPASARPAATVPPRRQSGGPSLTKGGNVSLNQQAPGLRSVAVGLGWDVRTTSGAEFDLDASAIATGADRRVLSDKYFVFFNNLRSPDGAIVHTGDNLTGDGDGDDEVIEVDLAAVSAEVTNIFFPVSIYDAEGRGQSFGQVQNAFIRVVDRATGAELTRYDLSEDASTETAMVFGELYRRGSEWKFRAVGQGYASGLAGIARDYGVDVD